MVTYWERPMYKVYLTDNTEYHFFTEESMLNFIKIYKDIFSYAEKIERAVIQ